MVGPGKSDHQAVVEGPSAEGRSRACVLYIEDDADNAQLVRVLLSRDPRIELITAADGSTGLAATAARPIDLVLLDLGLPDMTGLEFLEALRGDKALGDVPVIVVTADADARDSAPLRAARVRACIIKPIEIRKFLSLVDDTLFPAV
jgi:ribose transport system substrate-binding protein